MKHDEERPTYEERGDADAELEFHLAMSERRLREEGLDPAAAAREARRRFGDRDRVLSECRRLDRRLARSERRNDALTDLRGDVRCALRSLHASPGFTVTVVVTLALAIGATTALFSLVRGVLLQPLDYREPGSIALLSSTYPERGWSGMPLPQGLFQELREGGEAIEELAVYRSQRATLLSSLEPRRLRTAAVSQNLLRVLGVEPALGRGFQPDDSSSDGGPCLISHRLWRSELGGDPGVLGRTLRLEGDVGPCQVIGVLPSGFAFPEAETDLWRLYRLDPGEDLWSSWFLTGVARIAPGADLAGAREAAQAELDRLTEGWRDRLPFGGGWSFVLTPITETVVGEVAPALWVLFGAVAMVLLIACIDLGGLLLARTIQRADDLAVRSALGASRWRLARQLLVEILAVCGLGGAAGLVLAHLAVRTFRARPPVDLPRLEEVRTDPWVLGFALSVTILCALLAWIAPLIQTLRGRMRWSSRSGVAGSRTRSRLRASLVVVEAALTVALLVGTGLLTRSFLALAAVDPGFDVGGRTAVRLELPPARYDGEDAQRDFYAQLLERVAALPPVAAAGLTTGLPLRGVAIIDRLAIEEEGAGGDDEHRPEVAIDAVSPGYFETIGVPLLEGRMFDAQDRSGGSRVAIVNDEIARRHFQGASPIGRRLLGADDETPLTIVGVVGSVKQYGLRKETPLEYFVPFAQQPQASAHLVVRSELDAEALSAGLKSVIADLDPALPVPEVIALERALSDSVGRERFYALAMGAFATLAAVLATLGLYGLIAFAVEQRRRELGIRLALGARRSKLFRSVVAGGMALGAAGVVLGLAAALLLARSLGGLLFGVGAADPVAIAAAALLVLVIAGAASSLPARRAIRVDPARALRGD
ncbi:MAG TPA: ABC transporter permease [Thermoanaerobaculia bacterium]|nr:ABC transporter permease [Thermoanaerobaculia bacterium]